MGGGNHFRQSAARIGPVRFLCAEPASGDDQLAGAGDAASANLLQPFVGVGMKTELEQVDTELDCSRDLVDVLATGSGRREEAFAQRFFGNLNVLRPHLTTRPNNPEAMR